jgi:glycosyltransferase involved in cell wall biosynthesis
MQHANLRILLVAEHASAAFGGEALIPFQYFKHLREMNVDVHLVVHERTRKELEESFSEGRDRLHFVSDSRLNILCYKIGRRMPDRLAVFTVGTISHFDTQIRQRRLVRRLLQSHGFDVIHEPIPVSPKLPSMLFGLSVPVIIGPMNGGMDYPPNYRTDSPIERLLVFALRCSAAFWNTVLPGKRHAARLLVANQRTFQALPAALRRKAVAELIENGVDAHLFRPQSGSGKGDNFQIIYVGRLVDWKRVDLLIAACAGLPDKIDFDLNIVGDGVLRGSLEEQVERLSLTDHVRFHGRLSQSAAADLLRRADVMVLPSMRECGGAVVLEAMASGIPVIATEWGGPIDYITRDTGILIPPATPETFVEELGKALIRLAKNPQERDQMGKAGRQRALTVFDWRAKAKTLLEIYQGVMVTGITQQQS